VEGGASARANNQILKSKGHGVGGGVYRDKGCRPRINDRGHAGDIEMTPAIERIQMGCRSPIRQARAAAKGGLLQRYFPDICAHVEE
jgi:hypothetical protein